mgnify:CR=1 FL=1
MRNLVCGVVVGLLVGGGLTWAGTFEEMERQRERQEQGWERYEQRQERSRQRQRETEVPVVEPVYPGLGRGPC